jgi:hypothetical protein
VVAMPRIVHRDLLILRLKSVEKILFTTIYLPEQCNDSLQGNCVYMGDFQPALARSLLSVSQNEISPWRPSPVSGSYSIYKHKINRLCKLHSHVRSQFPHKLLLRLESFTF